MSNDNAATLKALYSKVMAIVHPDKVSDDFKAEATKLSQIANRYKADGNVAGLQKILDDYNAGKILVDWRAKVREMIQAGKSKTQAKGFASFNDWPKHAVSILDEEYKTVGRAGSASKADVVKVIIELEKQGKSNADIAKVLMTRFEWAEGTAKTVVAHISYMHAYAAAIKG